MVTIKVKGIELTMGEAREVYNELCQIFGEYQKLPIYQPYPVVPYSVPQKWEPIITCRTEQ